MSCFQWQNHVADYLDGNLAEPQLHQAEEHLETCKDCTEHLKHYRQIIAAIANQPRSVLPAAIKKAPLALPLAPPLSRAEFSFLSLSRWQKIPWYFRTLLEGLATIAVITIGISSAPKLKDWYEKRSSDAHNSSESKSTLLSSMEPEETDLALPLPLQQKKLAVTVTPGSDQDGMSVHPLRHPDDELAGENENESESSTTESRSVPNSTLSHRSGSSPGLSPNVDKDSIRIGSSQLWRFTLKTVSPDELRPRVILALRKLNIPADTPGLGGNQVPGGIEFDLILAQSFVPEIKHALQRLAPESIAETEPGTFSWYKVHSKRKIPDGKSQVVIWLSQP